MWGRGEVEGGSPGGGKGLEGGGRPGVDKPGMPGCGLDRLGTLGV